MDKLYTTKEQHGTKSAYIYRIVADNGKGMVTAMPSITKKNRQPVTGLRRVELTTHFHVDDLQEYDAPEPAPALPSRYNLLDE
jgi:hypothetical protein